MDEKKWRVRDLVWWPVETEYLAKSAVFICLVFTCYKVLAWTIHAIFWGRIVGPWGIIYFILIDVMPPTIFVFLAWGLFRINRKAAIVGFIYFSFMVNWSVYNIITGKELARWAIPMLLRDASFAFLYLQGFRGATSYKRLQQNEIASTISEP